MQVAIIAAGAAVFSNFIIGCINLFVSLRQKRIESHKRQLITAYTDIIAFYKLEELYTNALADGKRTANAIKLETRKKLHGSNIEAPSKYATATECRRKIKALS